MPKTPAAKVASTDTPRFSANDSRKSPDKQLKTTINKAEFPGGPVYDGVDNEPTEQAAKRDRMPSRS